MRWLLCVLFGHRWGRRYEIGDSGEYDCDCLRCGQLGGEFDDDEDPVAWRWRLLRARVRRGWHALLCRLGRHVPFRWDDGMCLCAWCWEETPARAEKEMP